MSRYIALSRSMMCTGLYQVAGSAAGWKRLSRERCLNCLNLNCFSLSKYFSDLRMKSVCERRTRWVLSLSGVWAWRSQLLDKGASTLEPLMGPEKYCETMWSCKASQILQFYLDRFLILHLFKVAIFGCYFRLLVESCGCGFVVSPGPGSCSKGWGVLWHQSQAAWLSRC